MSGGALAALLTLGPRILDVRDLGWLMHGTLGPDPVAYLMAWRYFAIAPWSLPLGANPAYGLELASAIFYVDVVPLVAIVTKALLPLLGEILQYWGPWLVLSAALQAAMAWRLLALVVRDPVSCALGALLFVWQPMLLNRMGGHFALVSQWALLWSLWLCLRVEARYQTRQWVACLGLVAGLNPYVMVMCLGLWVSDLAARFRDGTPRALLLAQAMTVTAVVAAMLWAVGYFMVAGEAEPIGRHYGEAQLDLVAPFDAVEWGRLLPALPGLRHWEHGGSYLGAGVLLLLAVAAWMAARRGGVRPVLRRHVPLLLMLGGMLAFAISHRMAVAGHVVTLFDPPAPLARVGGMLRSSERFFWPLGYASIFAAIALLATRVGTTRLRLLLLAAFLVQAIDVDAGMARFRALVAAAPKVAANRLPSAFWPQAALRYARVRAVPAGNFAAQWEPVARFASRYRLPTDAVYLSRVDPDQVRRLNARTLRAFRAGEWERGTLYVIRDAATQALVNQRSDSARDLLAVVDGVSVFAPGWYAR